MVEQVSQSVIDGWSASPFSITRYAPSHRQFRLSATLTPAQITLATGVEPKIRRPGGKVSMTWSFYAEKRYWHNGKVCSVSTCCKIWDYGSEEEGRERWSAYGFPEAFAQIGLEPKFIKDYDNWHYKEGGNPTIAILTNSHRQQAEQRLIDIAQACLDQGLPLAVALEMMRNDPR